MRLPIFAATAFAAGLSLACAAAAESPWYVSADFGGYFRQQDSVATTFSHWVVPPVPTPVASASGQVTVRPPRPPPYLAKARGTTTRDFDPGVSGHVALGYRLSPRLRLEGELGLTGYAGSTIYPHTTDPNFPRLDGSAWSPSRAPYVHNLSGAVNAFYDFRPVGEFTPYVGLGLGAWDAHQTGGYYPKSGTYFALRDRSDVEGFGQAEAGVNIRLSRRWTVTPAYRFVRGFASNGDTAHVVKVGLHYAF